MSAKNVFKLSKCLFRLLIFKCKIEEASFSEEFNSTVMLSTVKRLVCSLSTELKKLTSESEESFTLRKSQK